MSTSQEAWGRGERTEIDVSESEGKPSRMVKPKNKKDERRSENFLGEGGWGGGLIKVAGWGRCRKPYQVDGRGQTTLKIINGHIDQWVSEKEDERGKMFQLRRKEPHFFCGGGGKLGQLRELEKKEERRG